ncbi:hypothetical protein EVAR_62574_1 [Eumeta japonica]|uniref:Uncharacterized protein n=1 Tax=Eumeta variegata TaxID=151549 RepID=A0A4C1YMX0_EUMVA|nr:hypothetical protein EVAR_62574_1 [Eumeta japonica]
MDEETQTLLTQWKMDDYIELFKEKPESNQSGVAVENAKEFSDVSDFILNINNELEDLPLGNYKIATTTEKRVQKVWSNKQKVIIIVLRAHLLLRKSLFEFEDSSDLLQWLENCTDPWDTVESHWIRTAGTRLKLVKNTNAPASVYINKYPALKTNRLYIVATTEVNFLENDRLQERKTSLSTDNMQSEKIHEQKYTRPKKSKSNPFLLWELPFMISQRSSSPFKRFWASTLCRSNPPFNYRQAKVEIKCQQGSVKRERGNHVIL